ncbi:hypothetical protein VTO42DRAFT_4195 [Malbranchea cinnamomea]
MSAPNVYILAAENPEALLQFLRSNPSLASSQDEHGYSLLHAASSYNHVSLLRALVSEFKVNVNLLDEDGETCLFVAESVEVARCLVEELGIDKNIKNNDGLTAEDAIMADGSFPLVAEYLKGNSMGGAETNGTAQPIPSLPPNVSVNFGTMSEQEVGEDVADHEFKRRIEELASRENFHSEEGQRELRQLVTEALRGVNVETQPRDVRRRLD